MGRSPKIYTQICHDWKWEHLAVPVKNKPGGFLRHFATSEELQALDKEYEKRKQGVIDVIPPRPPRRNVGKLRKAVDTLLGIVRRARHHREKPAPGTPRPPRKPVDRGGEYSDTLVLEAILKQDGRCIYCHHKFMTRI